MQQRDSNVAVSSEDVRIGRPGTGGQGVARPAPAGETGPAERARVLALRRILARSWAASPVVQDGVFLTAVILASAALYVGRLGFYSDDWSFLGDWATSRSGAYLGLSQHDFTQAMMRPVELLYLAGAHVLFGTSGLGYQLFNTSALALGVLLFYVLLRQLDQGRVLALAAALVFGLLPTYSADRFWLAAHDATISMALFFASACCDIRAAASRGPATWAWKAAALLLLMGSALAYEVFMPLFVAVSALVWLRRRHASPGSPLGLDLRTAALAGSSLVALLALVAFKAATTTRDHSLSLGHHVLWLATLGEKELVIQFGIFGVGSPLAAARLWVGRPSPVVLVLATLVGAAVLWYLRRAAHQEPEADVQAIARPWMAAGLLVFGLGYAIFLSNENADPSSTGLGNRVTIGATVGAAIALVATFAWLSARVPSSRRQTAFAGLVGLLCLSSVVSTDTLGSYWDAASNEQQQVLSRIHERFPSLPSGTTLILDGTCRYVGPGVVFEAQWDVTGALRSEYHDISLLGDVVTPSLTVGPDGLTNSAYSAVVHYPYGSHLVIYNVQRNVVVTLPDAAAARAYFARYNPDRSGGCPAGYLGSGVSVL